MANRLFNGRRFSENGWPYVDQDSCTWAIVPGTDGVSLQIQNGVPFILLRAWAADWNAYIEPLRDADSACWTPGNSVATSNHPGGTAVDLNWESHPFQKRGSLNSAQMATMAEMEEFYEGNVFWAGRWNSPVDEMHSQVGYNTYDQSTDQPLPKVIDFIARKIRADGYSTYRRTAQPVTGPAQVLAQATGLSVARCTEILPAVTSGLQQSDCANVKRIAMWLAQIGHESGSFVYTEEIAKNGRYAPYIGRTWVQITWDYNYRAFSQWAYGRGICPTPMYFVENPTRLAELQYAGIGAAWYWTVARPDINELSDAGDIDTVTYRINGGLNGIADRTNRYHAALAMGDQLLSLLEGDDMFTDADRNLLKQISEIRRPSLSPFRWPGEGNVNTCAGFSWSADGNVHVALVERLAVGYGDPQSVAMLQAVALCGENPKAYPDRQNDAILAGRILTKVADDAAAAGKAYLQAWFDAEKK